MTDRCVCCGDVIPEGRMVCVMCERTLNVVGVTFCRKCEYYRDDKCHNFRGLYRHPKPNSFCSEGVPKDRSVINEL